MFKLGLIQALVRPKSLLGRAGRAFAYRCLEYARPPPGHCECASRFTLKSSSCLKSRRLEMNACSAGGYCRCETSIARRREQRSRGGRKCGQAPVWPSAVGSGGTGAPPS